MTCSRSSRSSCGPIRPTAAQIADGRLWGRGATDNKSGVLAFTKAAKAWLQTSGDVPVNLKFITEGEEEIGSVHLGPLHRGQPGVGRGRRHALS